MGQGMRVTVDAAMRARDISRIRPQDEAPLPSEEPAEQPAAQPSAQPSRGRRAEKRRLAKRRAAKA
ncbi:hypothetical protein [Actinomadura sp. DC4]|uniref:hypothetical protein n=1 Tax=Actinomadura sp. DC4 TaxID=3055069 RepID=UPI0025AF6EA1|nr:hypothetical protein [Actinomadura sp. DC4]MDN3357490.1 hypothetical protein [Actinomadura sp. DC4]